MTNYSPVHPWCCHWSVYRHDQYIPRFLCERTALDQRTYFLALGLRGDSDCGTAPSWTYFYIQAYFELKPNQMALLPIYIKLVLPPISVPPCPFGISPFLPTTNSL